MQKSGTAGTLRRKRKRDRIQDVARRVNRNSSVRAAARVGLVANGIVHIVIGGIAVGIAHGFGGTADQAGAFSAIAATPGGLIALWFAGISLWGLALWQWTDAAWVTTPVRRTLIARRLKDFGKALGFAGIGTASLLFVAGRRSDDEGAARQTGEFLISSAGGIVILIVVSGIFAGVGGGLVFRGISRNFREETTELRGAVRVTVDVLGTVGHIAKGLALLVVGGLGLFAAVFADPDQVGGLDGALRYLATLTAGPLLLDAVAGGLVFYGLYLLARATFLRK